MHRALFTPKTLFVSLVLALYLVLYLGLAARSGASAGVTGYAPMAARLRADAARSPWLRLASVGKSARGQRDLWLVRAADPAADQAKTLRILVLCRQHGDEPASTEAILGLVHRLAVGGDPSLRASLARVTLYMMPMVNPDGAETGTRANGLGADLNRDWGVFRQPETRAVADAARRLHPHLVIDAHNWDGDDEYDADCLEVPRESATPEGRAGHALQQEALRTLAADGYPVHPTAWGADSDPRLAHRWFARRGVLSALVETHAGLPTDRADFERRQGMYVALIHGLTRDWAASPAARRRDLGTWEADASTPAGDAALFPPHPVPHVLHTASAPRRSFAGWWLWPLLSFGLALWASRAPSRVEEKAEKAAIGTGRAPGRYPSTGKKRGAGSCR
jgi:hypothetical protein